MKQIILVLLFVLFSEAKRCRDRSDSSHSSDSSSDEEYEDHWDYVLYSESNEFENDYDSNYYSSGSDENWMDTDVVDSSTEQAASQFNFSGVTISGNTSKRTGTSKISATCFLFGSDGCKTKCNMQCTLYDCTPRTSGCDNSFHCDCEELYTMGSSVLSQRDFELLKFNELWDNTFEKSIFSNDLRQRIRQNANIEQYVLGLLRNTHISGDDIKALLEDRYPCFSSNLFLMRSRRHAVKNDIIGIGKQLMYPDLDDHFDQLLDLMETHSLDSIKKEKHQRRIKKFLKDITDVDDLEELLHLIKMSGNDKLYRLAKSILKREGYGFEEDEDKATVDKKIVLKTISGNLDEADEDEIFDVAFMKKFMYKESVSSSAESDEVIRDVDTVQGLTEKVSTASKSKLINESTSSIQVPKPVMQATTISIASTTSPSSNAGGTSSSTNNSFLNVDFGNDANAATVSNKESTDNARIHTLYSVPVDKHAKMVQTNGVPDMSVLHPMPNLPHPPALSSISQTHAPYNYYGMLPYYILSPPPYHMPVVHFPHPPVYSTPITPHPVGAVPNNCVPPYSNCPPSHTNPPPGN